MIKSNDKLHTTPHKIYAYILTKIETLNILTNRFSTPKNLRFSSRTNLINNRWQQFEMKKIIFNLLLLIPIFLHSQSKEELLNATIENIDLETIQKIKDAGLLTELDLKIFPIYLVEFLQKKNISSLKYRDLLENFNNYKQEQKQKLANENNFGKDSVFIRTPYGDKFFIGTAQLSLEKLISRESQNLPNNYDNDALNQKINSPQEVASALKQLKLSPELLMLFGNVLMIIGVSENELHSYKVGDFVEISNRISKSKEFKPFMEKLKKL